MHAVVVRVTVGDAEIADRGLREQVVPGVSGASGFVAGYWTRSDDGGNGLSMLVFESRRLLGLWLTASARAPYSRRLSLFHALKCARSSPPHRGGYPRLTRPLLR
jgi:hypothetical protein